MIAYLKNLLASRKGFTLIELLIVIAILGILAVGLLIALDPVEQTRRASDTATLQSAGEIKDAINRFYAGHLYYPWCATSSSGGNCTYLGSNGCTADGVSAAGTSGTCANYVISNVLVSSGELKNTPPTNILNALNMALSSTGTVYQISFIPGSKSFKTNYASSIGSPGIYTTTACTTLHTTSPENCPSSSTTCAYCVF